MSKEFVYVAAPYTHDVEDVVLERIELIYNAMAFLSKERGLHVTTPLFMHELCLRRPMPGDYAFWQTYCLNLLKRCDRLIVLKLEGWEESKGVKEEIRYCIENNIPYEFFEVGECYES
ncbi:MAG TPA: DUF1937 family protein [Methanosarcina sp.]|nr:DUF1937 family protein [Methanosarcina sp.]